VADDTSCVKVRAPHDEPLRNRQILWIAGEGMITRRPW
jgi:hypothetical protein